MDRITGRRLEHLGEHAVGITREHIAQRGRLGFRRIQLSDMQPYERSAELDRDARIGRQISLADNSPDGELTRHFKSSGGYGGQVPSNVPSFLPIATF